jgi:hypothetical protein
MKLSKEKRILVNKEQKHDRNKKEERTNLHAKIKTQLYLLTIIISYINVGGGECAI